MDYARYIKFIKQIEYFYIGVLNMVSKMLNTVSILPVSGVLLGSVFATTSKAMDESTEDHSRNWVTRIVHYSCKVLPAFNNQEWMLAVEDYYVPDWKTLQNIRLTSHV